MVCDEVAAWFYYSEGFATLQVTEFTAAQHYSNEASYAAHSLLCSGCAAGEQWSSDRWERGGRVILYIPGIGFLPGSLLLGLPDCCESANM